MSFASLRDFIQHLESRRELVRVHEPVSTHLEMTEIQTRLLADGGPAVLFENAVDANGTPAAMPVLANLFGTVERVAAGIGRKPGELRAVGETLAFLRQPEPPGGWREAFKNSGLWFGFVQIASFCCLGQLPLRLRLVQPLQHQQQGRGKARARETTGHIHV